MQKKQNFTLIEILVVIAIIGVLASILMTGGKKLRQRAQVTDTRAAMFSIKAAIISYKKDYGSYPIYWTSTDAEWGGKDWIVWTSGTFAGDRFMNVLSGQDNTANPRRINFLPKNYNYKAPFFKYGKFEGYSIIVAMDRNNDGSITGQGIAPPWYGIKDSTEQAKYENRPVLVFMQNPLVPENEKRGNNITTF